jgi:C1A family cysteine protease
VSSDSGAMLRDGIKSLARQGVCSEKSWPYIISRFTQKPDDICFKEGAQHTISSYHRLNTVDEMRACLAEGFPFVFGFTVYDGFESSTVATNGVVNLPKADERPLGGHAVMAAGYDDKSKRFTVRNSWGAGWGKKGYFTIPYAYLADRNLSDDFWTVRK